MSELKELQVAGCICQSPCLSIPLPWPLLRSRPRSCLKPNTINAELTTWGLSEFAMIKKSGGWGGGAVFLFCAPCFWMDVWMVKTDINVKCLQRPKRYSDHLIHRQTALLTCDSYQKLLVWGRAQPWDSGLSAHP